MSVKLSPWPKIGEQMIKATPTSEPSHHRLNTFHTCYFDIRILSCFKKMYDCYSLPRSWSTTQISWISGRIETLNYCTHTFNGIFFCDRTSCSLKCLWLVQTNLHSYSTFFAPTIHHYWRFALSDP